MKKAMFKMHSIRWLIDGPRLVFERLKMDLSQAEFARRAGWSAAYQCRLEHGNCGNAVVQDTKDSIDSVLK